MNELPCAAPVAPFNWENRACRNKVENEGNWCPYCRCRIRLLRDRAIGEFIEAGEESGLDY